MRNEGKKTEYLYEYLRSGDKLFCDIYNTQFTSKHVPNLKKFPQDMPAF